MATQTKALLADFYAGALEVVELANRYLLQHQERGYSKELKADQSWVTDVDREVENVIRKELGLRFPDHRILGEEFGTGKDEPAKSPQSSYIWTVDPIDGTLSFLHNLPNYGIILSLHEQQNEDDEPEDWTPLVAVIDHPAVGLRYHASQGGGSYLNSSQLRIDTTPTGRIDCEFISIPDRANFVRAKRVAEFVALHEAHERVRNYADCFGHTLAAAGRVGAMTDLDLRFWDISATKLLVEEAGGCFELVRAERLSDGSKKYDIVAGKPEVVDWLKTFIRPR